MDHPRRIRPWWVNDLDGNVFLTVRSGFKVLEFEGGKTGVAVGSIERLEKVLDTLIAAAKAGELDGLLEASKEIQKRGTSKAKKVA